MTTTSLKAIRSIATGVIEGACRHLVKDRMERAGMRWSLEGAQAMLDLRSMPVGRIHGSPYPQRNRAAISPGPLSPTSPAAARGLGGARKTGYALSRSASSFFSRPICSFRWKFMSSLETGLSMRTSHDQK